MEPPWASFVEIVERHSVKQVSFARSAARRLDTHRIQPRPDPPILRQRRRLRWRHNQKASARAKLAIAEIVIIVVGGAAAGTGMFYVVTG
jgi:hypothetical protein